MGLKDDLGSITASIEAGGLPMAPKTASKNARTAPGALFAFSEQSRQMERELDELKKGAGAPRMLKRSALRPSPFQTRGISKTKVAELLENLRENDLASPIVVREIEPEVFEIIAGHHRDAAFGGLGRDEIPGIVVVMSDDQAERAVFFDNFFPPEVTDYEKFLGLKQIQTRHGYTHDQLAQRSGISRPLVGFLMAFERLPESALKAIGNTPALIGAAAAAKLAQIDAKHALRIGEALQLLADGKLNQAQLVDWVIQKEAPKRAEPTAVKSGKSIFAKVLRREGRLTIDFTNVDDAAALEREITTLIKERAITKK